jgi:hypothetical protein
MFRALKRPAKLRRRYASQLSLPTRALQDLTRYASKALATDASLTGPHALRVESPRYRREPYRTSRCYASKALATTRSLQNLTLLCVESVTVACMWQSPGEERTASRRTSALANNERVINDRDCFDA